MKKSFFVLLFVLLSAFYVNAAYALDLSYPGFTWGELRTPSSPYEETLIYEGAFEQGVQLNLSKHYGLDLFGEARYTLDSKGYDWNNKIVPGVGVKMKFNIKDGGVIQVGVKYVEEYRLRSDRHSGTVVGFINYWYGWQGRR